MMNIKSQTSIRLDNQDADGKGHMILYARADGMSDAVQIIELSEVLTAEEAVAAAGALQELARFARPLVAFDLRGAPHTIDLPAPPSGATGRVTEDGHVEITIPGVKAAEPDPFEDLR